MLTELGILGLATASISTTIARSKVTAKPREWLLVNSPVLGKLVGCPYCLSHWVALGLVGVTDLRLTNVNEVVDIFVSTFAVVAVAALIMGAMLQLLLMNEHEIDRLQNSLKEAKQALQELIETGVDDGE